ncbi:MAG TPA: hypothetical protein EYG57_04355 [Planctomycetes bacterium]|nr:hypothetical protein [Planctomycetota bacterium]
MPTAKKRIKQRPTALRVTKRRRQPSLNSRAKSPKFPFRAGLQRELQLIRRNNLGMTLVLSLRLLRRIPWAFQRMVRQKQCQLTCAITNLGDPVAKLRLPRRDGRIVAGKNELLGLDLLAPWRSRSAVSFSVFTYPGRLCINLHYDPRVLESQQVAELIDTYRDQLCDAIGSNPRVTPKSAAAR